MDKFINKTLLRVAAYCFVIAAALTFGKVVPNVVNWILLWSMFMLGTVADYFHYVPKDYFSNRTKETTVNPPKVIISRPKISRGKSTRARNRHGMPYETSYTGKTRNLKDE